MAAKQKLKVRLLGSFEVIAADGHAATLPTRKAQALLALLALRPGQAVLRHKLCELMWPEVPFEQARHSLRQALFSVRRVAQGALSAGPRSVALTAEIVSVDVTELEQELSASTPEATLRALQLYRADLLDGFSIGEQPFAEFVEVERLKLRERVIAAVLEMVAYCTRAGDTTRASELCERLLQLDSLQERSHRAYLRLLLLRGDHAAALSHYAQFSGRLRNELGREPDEKTRSLVAELPRSELPITQQQAPEVRAELAAMPRVAETAWLRAGWQNSRASGFTLLGEAGVGKTHLCEQFASEVVASGGRVLRARCFESEQVLPHALWASLLESAQITSQPALLAQLPVRVRQELSRLIPEIGKADGPRNSDAVALFRALDLVLRLVSARGPVLLLLEDLHWADGASLRALSFLSRRRTVRWIGTVRPEELPANPELRVVLDELARLDCLVTHEVSPFSQEDSMTLAALWGRQLGVACADDASWQQQLWLLSEGNALVMLELVAACTRGPLSMPASSLPQRVRALIRERIRRLSPVARELVQLAAVHGRVLDLALADELFSYPGSSLAADELVQGRVLRSEGEGLAFVHERVREAVQLDMEPARRQWLHAVLARSLEQRSSPESIAKIGQIGYHYSEAGNARQAIPHLLRFASRARLSHATSEALLALDRVRRDSQALPANEQQRVGVEVTLVRAPCLAFLGRHSELATELELHAPALEALAMDEVAATYHFWWAFARNLQGDLADAEKHARAALASAAKSGNERSLGFAHGMLAYLCATQGQFQEGFAHAERAVNLVTEESEVPEALVLAPLNGVLNLLGLGRWRDALSYAQLACSRAEAADSDRGRALAATAEALVLLDTERWTEARAAAERAVNATESPVPRAYALWVRARAQLWTGEERSALATLEALVGLLQLGAGVTHLISPMLVTLVEARLRVGDAAAALEQARQAVEISRDQPLVLGYAYGALARTHAALGENVLARSAQASAVDAFTRLGSPVGLAGALVGLAALERSHGSSDAAVTYLHQAHAIYEAHDLERGAQRVAQLLSTATRQDRPRRSGN